VREQIELLEHHAEPLPNSAKFAFPIDDLSVLTRFRPSDQLAVKVDLAGGGKLHEVQAAKKRALARSRPPDDGDTLAGFHREVDASQDVKIAEPLLKPANA
jgi:hypothetical protein